MKSFGARGRVLRRRAHSDDEYLVIEGNSQVAVIVRAEQAIADILYGYGSRPEPRAAIKRG